MPCKGLVGKETHLKSNMNVMGSQWREALFHTNSHHSYSLGLSGNSLS